MKNTLVKIGLATCLLCISIFLVEAFELGISMTAFIFWSSGSAYGALAAELDEVNK